MSNQKKGCLGYNLNNKGNYLQYVLVGSRNETSRGYFVANFCLFELTMNGPKKKTFSN